MTTKRDIFKRKLPIYMDKARIRQIDLAKAVGVSKGTVSCWINGKAFPHIDTLQKIADVLGCRTDDLIVEQPERNRHAMLDLISPSQPLTAGASLIEMLERRTHETPKEDAEMAVLWRHASITAKRAAIAVLNSMKENLEK